jgi:hypothetical protein
VHGARKAAGLVVCDAKSAMKAIQFVRNAPIWGSSAMAMAHDQIGWIVVPWNARKHER